MGCRELDITSYYRLTDDAEKSFKRVENSVRKNRYKPVFHTVISNYRYYSPEIGRWLSRDPIWERGGWNLYGFLGNDPIRFTDMLGTLKVMPDKEEGKATIDGGVLRSAKVFGLDI